MKTIKNVVILLVVFVFFALSAFAGRNYYIKNDNEYGLQFLCFSEKECYNCTPSIIKVKDKTFVGFGGFHVYDINTYKYDKNTDTYTVDMAVDRDPSTDNGYYTKCPYDKGYITDVIFTVTYIPSRQIFKVQYKGFISSEPIVEYDKNNNPVSMITNYLNIYYNSDSKLIEELEEYLKYYNIEVPKTINEPKYGGFYAIEIIYLLNHYLNYK